MSKKIIFSGGGTGGHIFPAINLMKYFFKKDYQVLLVTDIRGNNFIKSYSEFKSYILHTGTPTNKNLFKKFFSYFLIFSSIIKSIVILKKEKPDLIFGFGGYVSFPIAFASKIFNYPLVIYENNMVLGRANKYLSSFSKKILLAKNIKESFPEKFLNKIYEVGSILDEKIINYSPIKENGKKNFFSILVLGGSQGAEIFGKVIPTVMKMLKDKNYEITINQQCTESQKEHLINFYKKNNIRNYVFEFDRDILKLISTTHLAITRSGASTTAELAHTFTPFIAVPLPNSIDKHQYLNAKYYENMGCCWLLEQNNFNTETLFNIIMETIKDKNKLENVRNNMRKIYNKNVYKNIEKEIKEFI
jgi:UDP-N-acetylglucosamine--N-acetylmuramyl-(pentapeptide) pyrophosphoryl-undecaprenol N-acetylglucosamine transferase